MHRAGANVITKHFTILLILILTAMTAIGYGKPLIRLETAEFDPLSPIQLKDNAKPISSSSPYKIVQLNGPILDEWRNEIEKSGAKIIGYIPDFAYLVRMEPTAETTVRGLNFVRWVGDYLPEYKKSPKLEGKPTNLPIKMTVMLFEDEKTESIRPKIVSAGAKIIHESPNSKTPMFRIEMKTSAISELTKIDAVRWIEEYVEPKLLNNIARSITNINPVWSDIGLYGNGQIVAVCDTGLDKGVNDSTLSADFRGRLLKAYPLGRPKTGDWSDKDGHGTHVAGTVLGNGALSGSNPDTHSYIGSFAGVAPEATLVFQSVADKNGNLTGIPSDLNQLFNPPYLDGARVHSNSWGSAVYGQYTTDAYNTDLFVWNHKDMVICVAAGNEGVDKNPSDGFVDPDSMDSPGTAKNCITVGATESQTNQGATGTWGGYWPSDFPTDPIKTDQISNNANGMAAWSSRGPTDDGRIKPDICAPGTNIISSRSHDPKAGTLWGAYNSDYLFCGGTSMATPHVAGASALVRQFYIQRQINPSAALIKATLLCGAHDMTPGQYQSPQEIQPRPNNVEGWGRLDLRNSLIPPSPRLIHAFDVSPGLSTGSYTDYDFYVISNSVPLHIMLVWTDYPGSTGASVKLVNDIDLTVTSPNGTIYRGNGTTDRLNNVEGVDIPTPTTGHYTIRVSGYNVPFGPQPYALVVSGAATNIQPTPTATIAEAKTLPDGFVVSLSGKVVSAGSDQFKNCFYIQEPDRSSGIKVQYGAGGGPTVSMGSTVNVTGTLTTIEGERVIKDPIIVPG